MCSRVIWVSFILAAATIANAEISDNCIDCLAKVEMGTDGECVMDQGTLSCGLYQLKKVYWLDCGELMGSHQACAADRECAKQCIRNYMKRYEYICKDTLGKEQLSCTEYGRIHNGGPGGCASWTDHYVELMNGKCQDEFALENAMSHDTQQQVVPTTKLSTANEAVEETDKAVAEETQQVPDTTGHMDERQQQHMVTSQRESNKIGHVDGKQQQVADPDDRYARFRAMLRRYHMRQRIAHH